MDVVLEPLDEHDVAPSAEAEPATTADTADAAPSAAAPEVPAKRPRGRPKGSTNKPKAPAKEPEVKAPRKRKRPPSSSSDSSESDEPPRLSKRSVVKHLMEDDMETQVLRFLTARKQNQEKQRRTLWQNLAASGLR